MQFEISEIEKKQARHPHEIFLINLITNHVLVFIALLGMAKTYPLLMLVTPSISLGLLLYILFRARRSLTQDPWFVKCHWQIAARRSRLFIAMLAAMGLFVAAVVLVSGGELKPQHYAFAGVGVLPTILTTLALIIMESDAMHQTRLGILPAKMIQQYPNPDAIRVNEE